MSNTPSNEDLLQRIEVLSATVEKQSKVIGQTGQRLMEMQISNVKQKISDHDPSLASKSSVDMDDYVTNEDIVQLVGELQGQLDEVENRSIKRLFNARLQEGDKRPIAPISNKDGDEPPVELNFPGTFDQFISLSNKNVLQLAIFYEIIIPNQPELEKLLESADSTDVAAAQQAHDALNTEGSFFVDAAAEAQYSQEQVDEIFDELARFLGLVYRRNKANW